MDQSRLEELKRLLQKRRGDAKQNHGEELGVENSETKNYKTKNLEVSNFESQDSEVSNSKPSNFEASNSETLNSDPDALNLEAEAAQNSACKNSAEPQNFILNDSGSLQQSPKARDYDKYPIILKDNS